LKDLGSRFAARIGAEITFAMDAAADRVGFEIAFANDERGCDFICSAR